MLDILHTSEGGWGITVPSGFELQYDNALQNRHGMGGGV